MQNNSFDQVGSRWKGRFPITLGFLGLALLIGTLGYWGATAKIAGAVIATGKIQVESNRQIVQHQQGGVVGAILVTDGDHVAAGDVLVQLDDTFIKSELMIVEAQLFELMARGARLAAERDDINSLELPTDLAARATDNPSITAIFEGQVRLFNARRASVASELEQLIEQSGQLENQVIGAKAELTALNTQLNLIAEERSDAQTLFGKGLMQASRVLALRREEANMQGAIGQLTSNIAGLRGQIAGIEIQKLRVASNRREQAISDLRDLKAQQSELSERCVTLKERLSRMQVRSPAAGTVFGSTVFALKSVLQPGAPLMFIVPQDQPLIVSARVSSIHIDKIHVGQAASLRFASFDQRRTPEITGIVSQVSADVLSDDVTGESYYQVELVPNADDLEKLDGQTLVPGMPVEAFVKTSERSPIAYLTKPLTDYFSRAMRND